MKTYVRWPFLVALVLTLGCAAVALQSPSTASILNGSLGEMQTARCPSGMRVGLAMSADSNSKVYATKEKFVIVRFGGDNKVKSVTFGTWEQQGGKVVVTSEETLSLEDATAKYPNPCDFLGGREV